MRRFSKRIYGERGHSHVAALGISIRFCWFLAAAVFSTPADYFRGPSRRRSRSRRRLRWEFFREKSCRSDNRLEIIRHLSANRERFDNARQCWLCHDRDYLAGPSMMPRR